MSFLCSDEEKIKRSAELLKKLNDNKSGVSGENTAHARGNTNEKLKRGIAGKMLAILTDCKDGQQTSKFGSEEVNGKDTDNKLLYKDSSWNSETPLQQTENLVKSKNYILEKSREQFEIEGGFVYKTSILLSANSFAYIQISKSALFLINIWDIKQIHLLIN